MRPHATAGGARRFPASTSATGRTTIDWEKVAGTGKRFVFLKATDGHDYLDPTFATNRAERS